MSKVLVLYKSKYGSTRQYAEWIAADLNADLREIAESTTVHWEQYTAVIFCGGVYANSINGMKALVKHHTALAGKKTVIVACGLSDPRNDNAVKRIETNLYEKIPQAVDMHIKLFMVQGGVRYAQLGFMDRAMLRFLQRMLGRRKPELLTTEQRLLLAVLGKDHDFTDRAAIQPIVDYCKTR